MFGSFQFGNGYFASPEPAVKRQSLGKESCEFGEPSFGSSSPGECSAFEQVSSSSGIGSAVFADSSFGGAFLGQCPNIVQVPIPIIQTGGGFLRPHRYISVQERIVRVEDEEHRVRIAARLESESTLTAKISLRVGGRLKAKTECYLSSEVSAMLTGRSFSFSNSGLSSRIQTVTAVSASVRAKSICEVSARTRMLCEIWDEEEMAFALTSLLE